LSDSRGLRCRARPTRIAVKAPMRPGKKIATAKPSLCWSTALSFLFFLVFSAPHRVHHVYEQLHSSTARHVDHGEIDDHAKSNDRRSSGNQPSKANDCVVLVVTQTAHLSSVSSFDLPVLATATPRRAYYPSETIKSFNASPASPRAPPRV
jgi:hypothetical protein